MPGTHPDHETIRARLEGGWIKTAQTSEEELLLTFADGSQAVVRAESGFRLFFYGPSASPPRGEQHVFRERS